MKSSSLNHYSLIKIRTLLIRLWDQVPQQWVLCKVAKVKNQPKIIKGIRMFNKVKIKEAFYNQIRTN